MIGSAQGVAQVMAALPTLVHEITSSNPRVR